MFQNVSRGKYCPQDPLGFAEVQFPDFVLTQFLCFGTNFVAFASIIIQSPSARVKILTYFQCWTKGRRSTAIAQDFRPTATTTHTGTFYAQIVKNST